VFFEYGMCVALVLSKITLRKKIMHILRILAAATLLTSSSTVLATVDSFNIDFENFVNNTGGTRDIQHGRVMDNEYRNLFGLGSGVAISGINNDNGPDLAVAFDSNLRGTRDHDLQGPFAEFDGNVYDDTASQATFSPGNILIIQENSYGCSDGVCDAPDDEGTRLGPNTPTGVFVFDFDRPIFLESIDFFDVEQLEAGESGHTRITLLDENGRELFDDLGNPFFSPETGGDYDCINHYATLAFNVAGVSSIQIGIGGSGAIDNIRGSLTNPGVGSVPEPATLALLAAGLFGAGRAKKRS
jgi:hypothetical protein